MRPLSWVVIGVSVAGLVVGTRVVSARRARPVVEPRAEEPAPLPTTRPPTFRPPPAPLPARPASALAHLRGRVIVPPGTKVDLDHLEVTATDGERELEAATSGDGRFQLHVPPRSYTVTARLGELIGVVTTRPGASEELAIRLQPGAVIEVDLEREELSDDLEVTATRAGTTIEVASADFSEERIRLKGLQPGALYDLTVKDGDRETAVRGVTAPATVRVALPERVTLHGAIGFEAGTRCPFHSITLAGKDKKEDRDQRVDANCRFELHDVDAGGEVHLRTSADGWHLDEVVRIPAEPEPFICLNPPCRDLPPAPEAELEVILTGAPAHTGIHAGVNQGMEYSGCGGSDDRCEVRALATDSSTTVEVRSKDCERVVNRSLVLHGGHNSVSVECRRLRVVEGVIRGRDPSEPAVVTCEKGGHAVLTGSVFELRCPGEAREILYRSEHHAPRRVAIPDANPAFVDLTL